MSPTRATAAPDEPGLKRDPAASPSSRHTYTPAGFLRADKRGRRRPICAVCDGVINSPAHRTGPPTVRVAVERRHPKRRPPRRAIAPRIDAPRELVMLAYMLDGLEELEEDAIGWRVMHRARELRAAMVDIPRADGARVASLASEVSSPPPGTVEPGARVADEHSAPDEPAPIAPILIEHAPPSERSRARALTKSISDKGCRELATRAILAGYHLKRGSNHWILEAPGQIDRLILPSDVSGYWRGWRNVKAHAKRLGIDTEGL